MLFLLFQFGLISSQTFFSFYFWFLDIFLIFSSIYNNNKQSPKQKQTTATPKEISRFSPNKKTNTHTYTNIANQSVRVCFLLKFCFNFVFVHFFIWSCCWFFLVIRVVFTLFFGQGHLNETKSITANNLFFFSLLLVFFLVFCCSCCFFNHSLVVCVCICS